MLPAESIATVFVQLLFKLRGHMSSLPLFLLDGSLVSTGQDK